MDKKFFKGGLIGKTKENEQAPVLLQPGVSYVSRAFFEKYAGLEFFKMILEGKKIIPIKDEKKP
jgi:hypothetical protein